MPNGISEAIIFKCNHPSAFNTLSTSDDLLPGLQWLLSRCDSIYISISLVYATVQNRSFEKLDIMLNI